MKRLILLTMGFPFGEGETFLETEVRYYSRFDSVFIYPIGRCVGKGRSVPGNVVVNRKRSRGQTQPKRRYSLAVWEEILCCMKKYGMKKTFGKAKLYRRAAECYGRMHDEADWIAESMAEAGIRRQDSIVIYSYWMLWPALTALFLKKKFPNARLVTRCHGGDLYEERDANQYLPFRKKIFDTFDLIVPISSDGKAYLQRRYGKIQAKIRVSRLGVESGADDLGAGGSCNERTALKLVSCSGMVPVKRIDRIIDALSLITECPIEWKHFGDGFLEKQLKERCMRRLSGHDNIHWQFMGRVSNQEMLHYYETERPHFLINTSESEGIPVSMMEAMSYGIPVIGTNVGGVGEIVINGRNGYLVDEDFADQTLAAVIQKCCRQSAAEYRYMSNQAWKMHHSRYDAKRNYSNFVSILLEI